MKFESVFAPNYVILWYKAKNKSQIQKGDENFMFFTFKNIVVLDFRDVCKASKSNWTGSNLFSA
jgi:hypothetical protein